MTAEQQRVSYTSYSTAPLPPRPKLALNWQAACTDKPCNEAFRAGHASRRKRLGSQPRSLHPEPYKHKLRNPNTSSSRAWRPCRAASLLQMAGLKLTKPSGNRNTTEQARMPWATCTLRSTTCVDLLWSSARPLTGCSAALLVLCTMPHRLPESLNPKPYP